MKTIQKKHAWFAILVPLAFGVACSNQISKAALQELENERLVEQEADVQLATFGGGCFWCTEAVFEEVQGVKFVKSGYSGGHVENPTYEQICGKKTGHAEVIQIGYDPEVVSFEKLVEVHLKTHDPTTLNRQGYDEGPQYRSAIFFHSAEQRDTANTIIEKLNEATVYPNPIVTEVTEFTKFYDAEDSHQNYYQNNPNQRYCRGVIQPKMTKFRKVFADLLKEDN
jgi:peptide-methionine (S)-S-oxide reductase